VLGTIARLAGFSILRSSLYQGRVVIGSDLLVGDGAAAHDQKMEHLGASKPVVPGDPDGYSFNLDGTTSI